MPDFATITHWLTPIFQSIAAFVHLDGYGRYVWTTYGFAAVILTINFYAARRRLHRAKQNIILGKE